MPLSPQDRKAELVRKGVSLTSIAESLGVTPQHVSQVLSGKRRSPTVEAEVALKIGKPVGQVFPPMPEPARASA
jgi:transcriptional regulator with XRE-family HTH domain